MVRSGAVLCAAIGGETAFAKRRQRSMQAAGEHAVPLKLIQPRKRLNTNGDAFIVAEASTGVHNKFFLKVLNRSSCDSSIGQIGCYREPF